MYPHCTLGLQEKWEWKLGGRKDHLGNAYKSCRHLSTSGTNASYLGLVVQTSTLHAHMFAGIVPAYELCDFKATRKSQGQTSGHVTRYK